MSAAALPRCSRPLIALVCAVTAALLVPAVAGAHLRTGTVAVDYTANVAAAPVGGFTARIYQSDRALSISVKPGHSVVVLGYVGEPFLRLDDAGVAVNAASATSAGTGVLLKGEAVSGRTTAWRLRRGRHSVVWHDARVQGLPPGVRRAAWSVPLVVDGRRLRLTGELVREPRPAVWAWSVGATLCAAVVLAIGLIGRATRVGAIVFAVTASIAAALTALGFALDTYASPGTWIAGLDELAFIAVGLGVLVWGPRPARAPSTIGLGLLAAAVGVSKGAVFLHPIVLSLLAGMAARLFVAVSIGAGVAAAVLGGASLAESPAARRPAMFERPTRS